MIPYSYNMVDMGGIDLAEANGTEVPGVYEKIVEAMNLCGDLILYNWKFAGINIAPSAYTVLQQANSILINGLIQVTELDQITVIGLPPPLVPVSPLDVVANGTYEADPPASGFNPVRVAVPVSSLDVIANGTYEAELPAIGFNPVRVTIPGPNISPITIVDNGVYSPPLGTDGYAPITVSVATPGSIETVSVFRWYYTSATTCWGIMKKLTGDVIGQNGDNANSSISLVGDLMTVTFHGTSQAVEVVANAAIKLKSYRTGRTLGPATMTEYNMEVNDQQSFTSDNVYGGIYFEATEI